MNFLNNKEELALRLAEILNYGSAKGIIELIFMIVCSIFLLIVIAVFALFIIIQYKKNKQEESEDEEDNEEDEEQYVNYTYNEAFIVLNNQTRAFKKFHKQIIENQKNENVAERLHKLNDYIKSVDLSHGILDELLTEYIYTNEFFKKQKYYNKFYRLFFKRNREFEKLQNLLEKLLSDVEEYKNSPQNLLLEEK